MEGASQLLCRKTKPRAPSPQPCGGPLWDFSTLDMTGVPWIGTGRGSYQTARNILQAGGQELVSFSSAGVKRTALE